MTDHYDDYYRGGQEEDFDEFYHPEGEPKDNMLGEGSYNPQQQPNNLIEGKMQLWKALKISLQLFRSRNGC
jgi:hypothetical protein